MSLLKPGLLALFIIWATILLLKGPLNKFVPNCSDTSFGFCMERSRP